MSTYRLWNNTDFRDAPVVLKTRSVAERLWRSTFRPRQDAGNGYSASYTRICGKCGGWEDLTAEYVTGADGECHCG